MNKNNYGGGGQGNTTRYHNGKQQRNQQAPFEYYQNYNQNYNQNYYYNEMMQNMQAQQQQYRQQVPQQSVRERAAKILEYKPRVSKNFNESGSSGQKDHSQSKFNVNSQAFQQYPKPAPQMPLQQVVPIPTEFQFKDFAPVGLPSEIKFDTSGFKTERNRANTEIMTTNPQPEKPSADKDAGWEMHKCDKCPGGTVDLIRKRVGICLNIMAKKDGIDKYDVSALTCYKCNLGFASKNKYIFYCDQCDNKVHPDGDCLLAEQYHARKRLQEKRAKLAAEKAAEEAAVAGVPESTTQQDQDVPATATINKQQAGVPAQQPSLVVQKPPQTNKFEQENADLKDKVKRLEDKIKVMTDNYAECQAENSQIVKNLHDQIKQDEQKHKDTLEQVTQEKEKELNALQTQIQHWDETRQNDDLFKKKHLEDQKQIKNMMQKNNGLAEQVRDLKAKNEKLNGTGAQLSELQKQQKDERKKLTELQAQLKECQEKLEKQTRLYTKGNQDLDLLHEELTQRDQDVELLQLQHDKLELLQIQKDREVEQMRKEFDKVCKELWVQREINDYGKSKMKDLANDAQYKDTTIAQLQDDQVRTMLQVDQVKSENRNMKKELVEMAQSIVCLPPGVVQDDRIVEVITDMAPRIIPTKEEIKKMECNFENLIPLLDLIFETFNMVEGADLLVNVGNTGCGKSTMINSLMFGPNTLEEKQLEFQVRGHRGRMKKVQRTVIEQKEEFKSKNAYRIDHSEAESSTFIPQFVRDDMNNIIYADVAGLNDASNVFIDFINMFIDRYIFLKAEKVRFLVPITRDQNSTKQYMAVRQQIRVLQRMFTTGLTSMIDCIQPLLTKCSPSDGKLDLEKIKADLVKQVMDDFKSHDEVGAGTVADQENVNTPELSDNALKQFYIDFVNKIQIFDPLDRSLPQQNNQAIKRDEILNTIAGMAPIPGGGVYAPFSAKHLQKFNDMISHEFKQCEKKVQQLIEEAEEMGEHYSFDLRYERVFESLERSLRYFAEKQLLIDGDRRLHKFYIYLKNSERMIELAQLWSGLSQDGQDILRLMQKTNKFKNQKEYADLVNTMMALQDKIDGFLAARGAANDGQEEDRNDIIAKQAMITLQECVQEMAVDPEEILKFAYELRKQDVQELYSLSFLNGQVRPPVLVEMFLANKWDSEAGKMTVEAKDHYEIMSGDKVLCQSAGSEIETVELNECNSIEGLNTKFKLLLAPDGLHVGSAEQRLAARQHGLGEAGQHQLVWDEEGNKGNIVWNLVPIDFRGEEPLFCVELPEADKRPRMMASANAKGVMVSTRDQDGYFEQSQTAWKILKTNSD